MRTGIDTQQKTAHRLLFAAGLVVLMVVIMSTGKRYPRPPLHFRADWFYVVSTLNSTDEAYVISAFPNAADCNTFAVKTKSRCLTGPQMTVREASAAAM